MNKAEKAVEAFKGGYNCSQSVLSVFCEELGLDRQAADRMAGGFGGGIASLGETCGAVSGAVMVLGLKHGMSVPGNAYQSNKVVYTLAGRFFDEFNKRNKSLKCRDILGFDLNDKQAYAEAVKNGTFFKVCPRYVADAVEILESLL